MKSKKLTKNQPLKPTLLEGTNKSSIQICREYLIVVQQIAGELKLYKLTLRFIEQKKPSFIYNNSVIRRAHMEHKLP